MLSTYFYSFADDAVIYFDMKGSEPQSKNYCFNVHQDDNMNINEVQYALWKVLKDHGYTLVDSLNADIIIDVNYFLREENRTSTNYVKIGEKNTQVMGANVPIPVWSTETHKFDTTVPVIQIKAFPKNASKLAMPYWQINMPSSLEGLHPLDPFWVYTFDMLWFIPDSHQIIYSFDSKGIKKIKVDGKTIKKKELTPILERITYLQSMPDLNEYNESM